MALTSQNLDDAFDDAHFTDTVVVATFYANCVQTVSQYTGYKHIYFNTFFLKCILGSIRQETHFQSCSTVHTKPLSMKLTYGNNKQKLCMKFYRGL
jgi:hypothetical protein